jgi:RNA polymerase sigma factor (sigma-70 family)
VDAETLARDQIDDMALPPLDRSTATKIGQYRGMGSLFNWLGSGAFREAFGKGAGKRRPSGGLLESEDPPGLRGDPFHLAADSEDALRTRDAFVRAWRQLTAKESLALSLKYGRDLDQRSIGTILRLSDSRVSRILGAGLRKLREGLVRDFESSRERVPGSALEKIAGAIGEVLAKNAAFALDLHGAGTVHE